MTCEILFQFRCRSQIGQRRLRQWLTLGMPSFLTAANLMGCSCNNGDEGAKQKLLVPGYANYKVIFHNSWDLKVIHHLYFGMGLKCCQDVLLLRFFGFHPVSTMI